MIIIMFLKSFDSDETNLPECHEAVEFNFNYLEGTTSLLVVRVTRDIETEKRVSRFLSIVQEEHAGVKGSGKETPRMRKRVRIYSLLHGSLGRVSDEETNPPGSANSSLPNTNSSISVS